MLDFGANSTDMSIMLDGYLVFSQSISIGSDSLTQSVINKFNFEYKQAEEYKRNYGVVENVLEGKIYQVLSPILESIMLEVSRGIEFYKNKTLSPSPTDFLLQEMVLYSQVLQTILAKLYMLTPQLLIHG